MKVKRRLQFNAVLSVLAAAAILTVLVLATYRVNRAVEASDIAGQIVTSAFERVTLRNDYVQSGSERAKVQWFAKHEQIGQLLKSAAVKFRDPVDEKLIADMIEDQDSIGRIFSAIVESEAKTKDPARAGGLLSETEGRLLTQLNMRLYYLVLQARGLQESSRTAFFSSLRQVIWGIIGVLILVFAAIITNSWTMSRSITARIRRLREGASTIGGGNLDHRIDIKGVDELAELSNTFNAMTGKLSESYHDLQREITERKQAEAELEEAKESLEQRVRERTMDLEKLTEQLEKSRGDLRKLASELVRAEERERKRIAGVLHDDIAQILASARIRLDMLHDIPSDQDKQTLTDAKALLLQSIHETRNLMSDIGNPLLFDMGLKLACEALAKQIMERHPIRISCDIQDAFKHLNPDMKAILFQVLRELLNNVVKHSQARNAHVKLDMEDGNFRVDVSDDGVGFDPKMLGGPTIEGGFGLYSIRERLIALDGSLKIESAPRAGTVVTALLPAALE